MREIQADILWPDLCFARYIATLSSHGQPIPTWHSASVSQFILTMSAFESPGIMKRANERA